MRILVADDDVDAAEMYKVALEIRGHHVITSFDGQACVDSYMDAMDKLRKASKKPSHNEPFGAIILDYKMPILDGLQVAKKILAVNASQRIIFASAFVKETLMESVKELNKVVEMIQKPFELEVLIDIVEDTSTLSRINDLNSLAAGLNEDSGRVDELLKIMKKIQKPGTI